MRRPGRVVVLCGSLVLSVLGASAIPGRAPGWGRAEAAPVIHLEPVLAGLAEPVLVTHAGDGRDRLFVVEQGGLVKVAPPGASAPAVFLDVRDRIAAGGERGLLGLAFHPAFADNRRLFVSYTRKADGAVTIAEYRASAEDPDVVDPAETPILVVPHPAGNHNGGMLAFGPDGYLYIAVGDGGGANDPDNRAQDLSVLLGKILRIDVDRPDGAVPYSSPGTNPFAGAPPARPEIFAYGFRNPWRFSFDRLTGDLYAGDVGQHAREEIDLVVAGGNYGWRVREGFTCTANDPERCDQGGFVDPLLDYKHKNGRCSVTGGYAYRGARGSLPPGAYVFADYCTGEIFLREGTSRVLLLAAGFFVSSFGEDEAGEIYVVDHGGAVHRIAAGPVCAFSLVPAGASFPPGARAASVSVGAGAACAWSAASHDPWITITSASAGTGDGRVTYRVAANPGAARTGRLTIAGQELPVSQAASPLACRAGLSPGLAVVPSAGGAGTVAVAIGAGCAWAAVSDAPWISVTSGAAGNGNGIVTFRVAPGTGVRRGSIAIAGRTFRVVSF